MDAVTQGALQALKPVGGFKITIEGGTWTDSCVHPYLSDHTYMTCRWVPILSQLLSQLLFITVSCFYQEHAGLNIIHLHDVESNISDSSRFGIVNFQFYRFLRLCGSESYM
jgi:hypothetical protein